MNTATALEEARPHLDVLVDQLKTSGAIRSSEWAAAFAAVPRHVFVPRWYEQETDERGIAVWRLRHSLHEGGLADAYRDTTLVTGLDPDTAQRVDEDAWTGVATSSSTLPRLMAGMLEDLDVAEGDRVLEIGTGTGYNAALLCHRLGSDLVHSIDIAPDLVKAAQEHCADVGCCPQLSVGDGQDGHPAGGPFDRIIATCSVSRIPQAWMAQTRPGGAILTDVNLGIESGLVRLVVAEDGRATGQFTRTAGGFMAARSDAHAYSPVDRAPFAEQAGTRTTALSADEIRAPASYPFRLLLAAALPGAELVYHRDDDTGALSLQLQRDGAWARAPLVGPGTGTVTYGGSTGLWETAEEVWRWWHSHTCPAQDAFAYRQDPDGTATVTHPGTGRVWARRLP